MQVGDIILASDEAQREYQGIGKHNFFKIMQYSDDVVEIVSLYDDGIKLVGTINLNLFKPIDMIDSVNDVLIMLLSRQKEINSIEIVTKCGRKIVIKEV